MNLAKFLRTPFLIEHLRRLLLELVLECQSMRYLNRNTIFSRMNIIFFSCAGNVTFKRIFSDKGILVFLPGGQYHICNIYTYIQKISYLRVFFDKDHLLSFSVSSNVNEVIRTVLNSLHTHTHTHTHSHTKHKNVHKLTKIKKAAFYAHKSI